MALDPLTALSLAGTIVQFVDFGCKIFSNSQKIYSSARGSLSVNEELESIITNLDNIFIKLRSPQQARDSCCTHSEQRLIHLCDSSRIIAQEILDKLQNLKVQGGSKIKGKFKAWRSLSSALQATWTQKSIDELLAKLNLFRDTIQFTILAEMR